MVSNLDIDRRDCLDTHAFKRHRLEMNNPKSTVLGWASLIAAAGVSYYYAKKGIDERRRQQDVAGTRPTEKLDWRARVEKDQQGGDAKSYFEQGKQSTRAENPMATTKTSSPTDEVPGDLTAKPSGRVSTWSSSFVLTTISVCCSGEGYAQLRGTRSTTCKMESEAKDAKSPTYKREPSFIFGTTRPKRKREPVVQDDDDLPVNWAPGVPRSMLSVYRLRPGKPTFVKDWNLSTGPLAIYQHTFLVEEFQVQVQEEANPQNSTQAEIAHSPSTATDVDSEDVPQAYTRPASPDKYRASLSPSLEPYPQQVALPTIDNRAPVDPDPSFHGPVNLSLPPAMFGRNPMLQEPFTRFAPPLGQSVSVPATRCPSPRPYPPFENHYPVLSAASRELSPLLLPPHPGTIPLPQPIVVPEGRNLNGLPHSNHCRQMGQEFRNSVMDYGSLQHRTLHPYHIFSSADPRLPSGSSLDGRRHSLPGIPNVPTPPPVPRREYSVLGPNQSSYYASLIPPRPPLRLSEDAAAIEAARRPAPPYAQVPWPQRALAQFPGPLRLSHSDVFPHGSDPMFSHYAASPEVHTPSARSVSSMTDSLPPSIVSSPAPSPVISGPSSGLPQVPTPRPPLPRADSWTTHFASLPKATYKPRKRKSRAKQPGTSSAYLLDGRRQLQPLFSEFVLHHQCPLCPRTFERRNGLAIHLKWHYKPVDVQAADAAAAQGMGVFSAGSTPTGEPGEGDTKQAENADSSSTPDEGPIQASASTGNLLLPSHKSGGLRIDHLLSSNAADIGPITPLATPPPSPSQLKEELGGANASMEDSSRGSSHHRSHSRIWPELFGSDD
ncbi:hypothetical protein NM688_g6936 [Phlebia brevispora]|uniref:Uncharacterized protein n=1 Tax=Phlebia brevispora TaxID=194682 RepID=A0ACC1SAT6_9APHY|nr:hypothetical protein NM688_g6936 [Phlebia brevispora]